MKKLLTASILLVAIGGVYLFSTWGVDSATILINTASTYGVLASTYTDTSASTTITGNVGWTTPPATIPTINGTTHVADTAYNIAGTDQAILLSDLNSQPCNFTFGSATDLSLLTQPLQSGVYCVIGAQSIGTGGISLTSGLHVFRSTGALNTVANSIVSGDACDVVWTPVATTLGANSTFKGMVIDPSGITVGAHVDWNGNALAFGGTITTDTDTILVPTCTSPVIVIATSTPAVIYYGVTANNYVTTTPVLPSSTVPVISYPSQHRTLTSPSSTQITSNGKG